MKTNYTVALAMLAGATLGAAGVSGLQAQGKPGAYAIIEINDITDADVFKTIIPKAGPAVTTSGGTYIIRSDKPVVTDGDAPKRIVVIGFDTMDKLKAWYASTAQKEVDAIRLKSTKSRQFFVEGFSN